MVRYVLTPSSTSISVSENCPTEKTTIYGHLERQHRLIGIFYAIMARGTSSTSYIASLRSSRETKQLRKG